MNADEQARPAGSARRTLVRLAIAAVVTLRLIEGAMRVLLFVDVPGLERWATRLRQPQNFFTQDEPGFWTTSVRFTPTERLKPVPNFDPVVGWTGSRVEPLTYEHDDEDLLLTRRPVLLYGDSFAECTTGPRECWQGLLQRSGRGRTHALLNYGVGGYGFDQTVLLMQRSLDRFADRDPIVIVSIFVDDDLNRILVPFRGWGKPRFGVRDGALVAPEPVHEDLDDALDASAPFVGSWVARYVGRRGWTAPKRSMSPDARPAIEELTRLLLAETKRELEGRGHDWFVLLFQGASVLSANERNAVWQYGFLVEELRAQGIPFVSVRRELSARAATPGADGAALFEQKGLAKGHYTALGNEVVFPAILRGIDGDFD